MGEWKECQLGDLIIFQRGHDLPKTKMQGGEYPVVGSNGIIGYHNEYTTEAPSITIGRSGNVGKPFLFKGRSWSHNTSLYIKEYKAVDPIFIYYLLQTLDLGNYAGGSAVPTLNRNHIHTLNVYVPTDIAEQRKIGAVLSAIDDKIELNNAINENLHQLIAAYYAEIFKDCEYSATISDYADRVFSGGTPTTSNESYWNGSFKWLSSGETSQRFIVDTEKTITQEGVDNSSTRLASKYNTVIASAGQGHTRGQASMLLTDSYVNQSIIVVDSEKIYMPFIYWNLCGRYEELRVISNSNSIRGSLTTKMISSFSSPKADIALISKFSDLAWSAIYEIEKNCNEIIRLTTLRDTLLPKLMNGEIDVSAVNI